MACGNKLLRHSSLVPAYVCSFGRPDQAAGGLNNYQRPLCRADPARRTALSMNSVASAGTARWYVGTSRYVTHRLFRPTFVHLVGRIKRPVDLSITNSHCAAPIRQGVWHLPRTLLLPPEQRDGLWERVDTSLIACSGLRLYIW